jgi:valyl-tRNA synthetase
MIVSAAWPDRSAYRVDASADEAMAGLIEIVSAIRRFRSEHSIKPSKKLAVFVVPTGDAQAASLRALAAEFSSLAGLEQLEVVEARPPAPGEQRLVAAGATVVIPLEGVVDVAAALADLDRQVAKLRAEGEKMAAKLGDDGFTSRAPANVVDEMRRRHAANAEAIETLIAQRDQLA